MSVAVGARRRLGHEHLALVQERPRISERLLLATPWIALGVFLIGQLVICALHITGPFLDEGIYIAAGLRTLQGHGISDNYMSWFSGSLIWPVIAAIGWKAWGLAGARAAAALCVTVGIGGALMASGNLLGTRVRAMAAIAAVTSGPVIALGHLAVYDTLAVGASGLSFWALTEFIDRNDRTWLCAAALMYALAGLAKYPACCSSGRRSCCCVVTMRGPRARMDLGLFAFIAGAVLLVYFLSDRSQLSGVRGLPGAEQPDVPRHPAPDPLLAALPHRGAARARRAPACSCCGNGGSRWRCSAA